MTEGICCRFHQARTDGGQMTSGSVAGLSGRIPAMGSSCRHSSRRREPRAKASLEVRQINPVQDGRRIGPPSCASRRSLKAWFAYPGEEGTVLSLQTRHFGTSAWAARQKRRLPSSPPAAKIKLLGETATARMGASISVNVKRSKPK